MRTVASTCAWARALTAATLAAAGEGEAEEEAEAGDDCGRETRAGSGCTGGLLPSDGTGGGAVDEAGSGGGGGDRDGDGADAAAVCGVAMPSGADGEAPDCSCCRASSPAVGPWVGRWPSTAGPPSVPVTPTESAGGGSDGADALTGSWAALGAMLVAGAKSIGHTAGGQARTMPRRDVALPRASHVGGSSSSSLGPRCGEGTAWAC
jgi:hypothetical protein